MNVDQNQPPLPAELIDTIERIRQQTAAPELVAKATSKAIELNRSANSSSGEVRMRGAPWLYATGIAASVVLATSVAFWTYKLAIKTNYPVLLHNDVIHSPLATSSFVLVGYRKVDEDLDRADAKVGDLSEALELAGLRREIKATLDEYYDWSDGK